MTKAAKNATTKEKCLTVDDRGARCDQLEYCCGLCKTDYATMRRVTKGKPGLRQQLEAQGRIKPRKIRRGIKNFFMGQKGDHKA